MNYCSIFYADYVPNALQAGIQNNAKSERDNLVSLMQWGDNRKDGFKESGLNCIFI